MLTDELKDTIRDAYAALMESKSLTPRWGQRQMIAARGPIRCGDVEARLMPQPGF